MKTYEFTDNYGDKMNAYLVRGKYYDGGLAVEMVADGFGDWEAWATLTVNLGFTDERMAFIDTNNCPWATEFLESNRLAINTGLVRASGYCTYPLYEFTDKFFAECEEHEEEE